LLRKNYDFFTLATGAPTFNAAASNPPGKRQEEQEEAVLLDSPEQTDNEVIFGTTGSTTNSIRQNAHPPSGKTAAAAATGPRITVKPPANEEFVDCDGDRVGALLGDSPPHSPPPGAVGAPAPFESGDKLTKRRSVSDAV